MQNIINGLPIAAVILLLAVGFAFLVTIAVCDRMANGIAEAIRNYSMTITPRAMFSRAVSGIRNNTVIINLPGSPKAVKESLEFLLPNLEHGLGILTNRENECGAPSL